MSVDLFPTWTVGSIDLTEYPYSVDRDNTVDIGEPEMIVEGIASNLADGDIERVTRHGNRTYVIPIYIEGPTLADVAEAEALLRAEVRRPDLELVHNPGDSWAVDSVYEVQTARLTPSRDDTHESHLIRKFTLTLTCRPWPRSADLVTVDAIATGVSAPTLIDDCSSATGWTATVNGVTSAPTLTSGVLSASDSTAPKAVQLRRGGTVSFASQRYLLVEVETNSRHMDLYAGVGGVSTRFYAMSARLLVSGWIQYVFDIGGASVTDMTFSVSGEVYDASDAVPTRLRINKLEKVATPPQVSPRQQSRIILPGGTERTPASIRVASADGVTGNGLTIVHTSPAADNGFAPDLSRWRVSGSTQTTNANTFSGKTEPIHPSPFNARLPITSVAKGGYLLCAVLKSDTVGTFPINWAVDTFISGAASGVVTNFRPTQFFSANSWHFCSIALVTLPTVQAVSGHVSAVLWYQGSSAAITLDEAFLFPVNDDSALTVVNGVSANLWLDSPSVMSGSQPKVWTGSAADRSNAYHPGAALFAPGNHVLHPEGTTVFAATNGADNPAVSSTHYRRWHSNAAE